MGVIIHSTRGNAATVELEWQATLSWFANSASQVSAHVVVAFDGTLAQVVPPELVAWHARANNNKRVGLELVQPRPGDPISDAQYRTAAWWIKQIARQFGFPLTHPAIQEHWEIDAQKSDVGPPFDLARLLAECRA